MNLVDPTTGREAIATSSSEACFFFCLGGGGGGVGGFGFRVLGLHFLVFFFFLGGGGVSGVSGGLRK